MPEKAHFLAVTAESSDGTWWSGLLSSASGAEGQPAWQGRKTAGQLVPGSQDRNKGAGKGWKDRVGIAC